MHIKLILPSQGQYLLKASAIKIAVLRLDHCNKPPLTSRISRDEGLNCRISCFLHKFKCVLFKKAKFVFVSM